MKRVSITVLALSLALLIAFPAFAAFDKGLIKDAKQALALISYGEYKKAAKKLSLTSGKTAGELKDFALDKLGDIEGSEVQTEVACAWRSGKKWYVAVPVEEPSYPQVICMVLSSKDGSSFDDIFSAKWSEVLEKTEGSDDVIWKDSYSLGEMTVIAD